MKNTADADGQYGAFTLVELLVSMTVLIILVGILASLLHASQSLLASTTSQIQKFQEAREAFEVVTRRLSQATLNTYLDYFDQSGNARTAANTSTFVPFQYGRQSELRFISGDARTLLTGSPPRRLYRGTWARRLLPSSTRQRE